VADLMKRHEAAGGHYHVCPVCCYANKLDKASLIARAERRRIVPMWQRIGDCGAAKAPVRAI
jgi:hypothetical protein